MCWKLPMIGSFNCFSNANLIMIHPLQEGRNSNEMICFEDVLSGLFVYALTYVHTYVHYSLYKYNDSQIYCNGDVNLVLPYEHMLCMTSSFYCVEISIIIRFCI